MVQFYRKSISTAVVPSARELYKMAFCIWELFGTSWYIVVNEEKLIMKRSRIKCTPSTKD